MYTLSVTESPSELTTDIDVASPRRMVRLLGAADVQIFTGYEDHPAIHDDEIVAKIDRAAAWMAPLLGRPGAVIVLAGAGTSGRIAMLTARTFDRALARQKRYRNIRYLIAGGDKALIRAQEAAEDDPHQAWRDLQPLIAGQRRVLYIGITCALAAPYVAGQIHRLSRRPGARCVLIGFNPEQCARDSEVENWDRTVADVVRQMGRDRNCMLLNPIVGPEPITGSTRMKSGSATKMLLEVMFTLGLRDAQIIKGAPLCASPMEAVRRCIGAYDQTRKAVYGHGGDIAGLIRLGGRALRRGGHIYYVGQGSPGILGIIDASECPPTFGAGFEDVRGFLAGGWRTLLGPGRDLSDEGPSYRIALADFTAGYLSRLTRRDLVVGLPAGRLTARLADVLRRCRAAGAMTALVQTGAAGPVRRRLDERVCIDDLPRAAPLAGAFLREYATKTVLNALTTGAHVLSGKVYRNRMVDLRISNNKLFYRAIGIIEHITGVSTDVARRCLLSGIYGTDRISPSAMRARPSQHVRAATDAQKVMPKALIMAGAGTTCAKAQEILQAEPVIRAAIERLKTNRKRRSGSSKSADPSPRGRSGCV